jgi:hypothetical protein
VPLEISLSTISTAEGEVAIAFILDITERIQHREHLQALAWQAAEGAGGGAPPDRPGHS